MTTEQLVCSATTTRLTDINPVLPPGGSASARRRRWVKGHKYRSALPVSVRLTGPSRGHFPHSHGPAAIYSTLRHPPVLLRCWFSVGVLRVRHSLSAPCSRFRVAGSERLSFLLDACLVACVAACHARKSNSHFTLNGREKGSSRKNK